MVTINKLKRSNMMAAYDGFTGPTAIAAIQGHISDELRTQLTGRQYGLVMSAVNRSYHAGKASAGAEVDKEAGYIWINCIESWVKIDDIKDLIKEDKIEILK